MSDDLGVGLAAQDVPGEREFLAQLEIVLDDPVVHHRDAPRTIHVGMGVLLAWPPVGGPAGMTDPHRAGDGTRRDGLGQVDQLADAAHHIDRAAVHDRYACRVISPVLETGKPAEQHVARLTMSYVADYSAHGCKRPFSSAARRCMRRSCTTETSARTRAGVRGTTAPAR